MKNCGNDKSTNLIERHEQVMHPISEAYSEPCQTSLCKYN